MTTDQTIAEFSDFIKNFETLSAKTLGEFKSLPRPTIPPFTMPGWVDPGRNLSLNLGLKRIWRIKVSSEDVWKLKKRLVAVSVDIERNGKIIITCKHPLDLANMLVYNSQNAETNINCFVIFSQLLKPILEKVIKRLGKIYRNSESDQNNHKAVISSLEKSFAGLVPFLVADQLGDR